MIAVEVTRKVYFRKQSRRITYTQEGINENKALPDRNRVKGLSACSIKT